VREAMIELCAKQGFDSLTVAQLVDAAMIGRATFYRYYRDKYDVIEEVFAVPFERLLSAGEADSELRRARWIEFFEHIAANRTLYKAVLLDSRSGWFARHLRDKFVVLTADHAGAGSNLFGHSTPSALSQILSGIFADTITWWLGNDLPISAQSVASGAARVAGSIIREAESMPSEPA
jgi:AcrR family transcriptional regulator